MKKSILIIGALVALSSCGSKYDYRIEQGVNGGGDGILSNGKPFKVCSYLYNTKTGDVKNHYDGFTTLHERDSIICLRRKEFNCIINGTPCTIEDSINKVMNSNFPNCD